MKDILVTGMPRSGLSAASALIDLLPNSLSLHAPEAHMRLALKLAGPMQFCKWLVGDFAWLRAQFLRQVPIRDMRTAQGLALFDGLKDPRRIPPTPENAGTIFITRDHLKPDFRLACRHHTLYSSLLPMLVQFEHFKIIAVVRNPLDVIRSWIAMMPQAREGWPFFGVTHFWPELEQLLAGDLPQYDKLAQVYETYLGRYHELREQIHILKYEEMVEEPLRLSALVGTEAASEGIGFLEQRTVIRQREQADRILEALRKYGTYSKLYYEL